MHMSRSSLLIMVALALLGLSCGKKRRANEQKLIRQGKGFLQRGKRERGIQALKQAFNLNPDNVDTTIVLAKALLENSDPRNASIALSTHLSKNKGSAYLWYLLGLSRYQERKSDAAIESLDEALKRKRAYPQAILLLGKIYEEHKELVAAKEAYLSVADNMALGKELTPILVKLARIELSSDKEQERANGVAHLLAALKLDPSSRDAHSALGLQYLKDKKPKRAIELFTSWIKHNPKDGMGHLHLGQALLMDTQYEKAIAQYEKAALLRPQDTLPLMGIAEVAAIIKKPERVYSALVKASALQPKNMGVKWRLIPFHMERERFEVALKSLLAVKGVYGTRPDYYALLTDAYFGLGEYASAYESHMKRLSLGASPTDAFNRRAGILARQAGYYPKAVEYLRPVEPRTSRTQKGGAHSP